jgi:hypothetical protein
MLINSSALPMEEPAIAAEAPTVMVKTRQTATEGAVSVATPPPPHQQGKPNTPSTDRTMPLPTPLQREVNKCHEKSCCIIASNILHVRLHRHIAKIKQMSTNVVKRIWKILQAKVRQAFAPGCHQQNPASLPSSYQTSVCQIAVDR